MLTWPKKVGHLLSGGLEVISEFEIPRLVID